MPNHIHGIIILNDYIPIVGANNHSPNNAAPRNNFSIVDKPTNVINGIITYDNAHVNNSNIATTDINASVNETNGAAPTSRANNYSPLHNCNGTSKTIGSIIRGFKIGVKNWFRMNVGDCELWQRNYWEHIIRDENESFRIRQYIKNNPINWKSDKLNGGTGNKVLEDSIPYEEEPWMV